MEERRDRDRPPVSVVVPFHGGDDEARGTLAALRRLRLGPADELIVADNTPEGVMARHATPPVRCIAADEMQSSYYARNVGAEHATTDWLVFIDSDCVPAPALLDAYFAQPVPDRAGAVAGEVVAAEGQTALAARYQRSRRHVGQAELRDHVHRPMAVTANVMVRRAAWERLGGFHEGIRSGGDADLSWRLQDAGWTLAYAPSAIVEHRHRETLRALVRQSARYGAGMSWLRRRHPGARFESRLRALARCAAGVAVWTVTLRFERALFKALDAVWVLANGAGALASNSVPPATPAAAPLTVLVVDRFPQQPAVAAARAVERVVPALRIEAARRLPGPERVGARGLAVAFGEDEGAALRLRDLAWLLATRPLRCLGELGSRRRSGARSLLSLAPAVRRTAATAGTIMAVGDGAAADAARLGRLSGVSVATEPDAEDAERAGAQIVPVDSP